MVRASRTSSLLLASVLAVAVALATGGSLSSAARSVAVPVTSAALPPRILNSGSFFGYENAGWSSDDSISGVSYDGGVSLEASRLYDPVEAEVSFNSRSVPRGYNALLLSVGIADTGGEVGTIRRLRIYQNRRLISTLPLEQGKQPQLLTLKFGGASIFRFVAEALEKGAPSGDIFLGAPRVAALPKDASPTTPAGAKLSAAVALPVVASGGLQRLTVTAAAGAYATIVVSYSSGPPLVVGPRRVGSTGRYVYAWRVPETSTGPVRVFVVAGTAVATTSFTIG